MVAEKVAQLGRGTNLGKVDIKSVYRVVPVNPEDRMLLGMQWQGKTFIDTKTTEVGTGNFYNTGGCS